MTLHNPPVNAIGGVMQEEILRIYNYTNHESDFWVCVLHLVLKTFSVGVALQTSCENFSNNLQKRNGA